jgi:hypothetical protein
MLRLEPEEAEQIKALGFHTEAGPWSVPPLPADLVAGNPVLAPLGDDVDSFWSPTSRATVEAAQVTITRKHGAEIPAVAVVGTPGDGDQDGNPSLPDSPRSRTLPDQGADRSLEKECTAVLAALERAGACIPKRVLQKKLWRIPADHLNEVIRSLVERGEIQIEGNALIAQPVPRSYSNQFHVVPQSGERVPRVESAPWLTGAPDQLTDFGGGSQKVIENAN